MDLAFEAPTEDARLSLQIDHLIRATPFLQTLQDFIQLLSEMDTTGYLP